MAVDNNAMTAVLNRLGRLEAWADLDQAQPYTSPQVITAIENRIVRIENVAEQVVNGALVPELRALGERVNSIGTAMDQTLISEVDAAVNKVNQTEAALQQLTAQLNAFPAQIQVEIANAVSWLNSRVDHWSQVLTAVQNGAPLQPGTGANNNRKIITEHKIVNSQGKPSNDKREY